MLNRIRDNRRSSLQDARILYAARKLLCLAVAIAVAGTMVAGCDKGEKSGKIWPAEYTFPTYFYSTDMSPVQVTLKQFTDPDPTHKQVLRIPRAAIIFANGYLPKDVDPLPDTITTDHLTIAVTYPDGEPLSVRAKKLSVEKRLAESVVIHRLLHPVIYKADIFYIKPGLPWEEKHRQQQSKLKFIDYYDGLRHVAADVYIGETGRDEFMEVRCTPEATPNYRCETVTRLGPNLVGNVDFPDFRFKGGRQYANERARRLREIVCQFVDPPCSDDKTSP